MASSINANNINGAYPIAGQDNDTQGFRDNFTNIKNNLKKASEEITDLQTKTVLRAPLNGMTLIEMEAHNSFGGVKLTGATFVGCSESKMEHLDPKSGTVVIDFNDSTNHMLETGNSIILAFANWPSPEIYSKMRVLINVNNIGHSITLPSQVTIGANSIPGMGFSATTGFPTNVFSTPKLGYYFLEFSTFDGGTTIIVSTLASP
jgi:hypothetical protein